MKILTALFATALAVAMPSVASAASSDTGELYGKVGGWEVTRNVRGDATTRCDLFAGTRDHHLYIAFAPVKDVLVFGFSIKDGANFKDGANVGLKIAFVSGTKMNEDFLEYEAEAEKTIEAYGAGRRFMAVMPSTELFLDSLVRAELLGIYTNPGSRMLAAIDLAGSGKAIEMLRQCAYSLPAN